MAVPAGWEDPHYGLHDKLTIYVGSQIPYADRHQVARCLGLAEDAVRVKGTVMGGGFGGKEDIAGQVHAALAATVTGRPVKVLYTREESLRFHPKRHATLIRIKTGARRDGVITAVEAELYGDSGAYASLGEKVMTRATTHATGPYVVGSAKIDCYAMYTNNAPCGAFRGFGVTQSAFAVESNMDILADQLGMDPVELRRINGMTVGTTTATGQLLRHSVGLMECLDKVEDEIRRQQVEMGLPPASAANGNGHGNGHGAGKHASLWTPYQVGTKAYAWGLAAGYKNTGLGGGAPDKAEAEVEVFVNGTASIRTSSAEMGQNLVGVLAACTAEELGLPFRNVHVLVMDTDLAPDGGPTTASRQTFVSGNAARLAARTMRERIQGRAGREVRRAARGDRVPRGPGLRRRGAAGIRAGRNGRQRPYEWARKRLDKRTERHQRDPAPDDTHHLVCRCRQADDRRGPGAQAALRILGAQDAAPGHRRRHARGLQLCRARCAGRASTSRQARLRSNAWCRRTMWAAPSTRSACRDRSRAASSWASATR